MKKSDIFLLVGGILGIYCFSWAYRFNIGHGKNANSPSDIWELGNATEPSTWKTVLLLCTAFYITSAYFMYKELKDKGKEKTGIIAASMQALGAVSIAIWLYIFAYDKYKTWEPMAYWVAASVLLLFVAPRIVIAI